MGNGSCVYEDFPENSLSYLTISHSIPREVQLEISRHIKNPDDAKRNEMARSARALYARIISLPSYVEVSLENITIPDIHEQILGPDSDTDKKLLGYAYELLKQNKADLVFLATRDAGISAEVVYQATRSGIHIFCDLLLDRFKFKVAELTGTEYTDKNSIIFFCTACSRMLKFRFYMAGEQSQCPFCHTALKVPISPYDIPQKLDR
jgi:hypothetical protein